MFHCFTNFGNNNRKERDVDSTQAALLKKTVRQTKFGEKTVLQKSSLAENKSIVDFGFKEHQSEIEFSSSSSTYPKLS